MLNVLHIVHNVQWNNLMKAHTTIQNKRYSLVQALLMEFGVPINALRKSLLPLLYQPSICSRNKTKCAKTIDEGPKSIV